MSYAQRDVQAMLTAGRPVRMVDLLGPLLLVFATMALASMSWYAYYTAPFLLYAADFQASLVQHCVLLTAVALMVLWSLYSCFVSEIAPLPADSSLLIDGKPLEAVARHSPEVLSQLRLRGCRPCNRSHRPRSTHHCSVCQTCVIGFDHHCASVGNCVGTHNYKAFLLLLFWGTVALTMIAAQAASSGLFRSAVTLVLKRLVYPDDAMRGPRLTRQVRTSEAVVISGLLFLTLALLVSVSTLFLYHLLLTLRRNTTIEWVESCTENGCAASFLGWTHIKQAPRSLQLVFGSRPLLWLLPIWTERDRRRYSDHALKPFTLASSPYSSA